MGRLPRPAAGRLASRAALICSGVRRSGSESPTRSFARKTWRLCRFANLLSIDTLPCTVGYELIPAALDLQSHHPGRKCSTSPHEDRTRLQKRAGQEQFRLALLLFELSLPRAVYPFEPKRAKPLHSPLVRRLLLYTWACPFSSWSLAANSPGHLDLCPRIQYRRASPSTLRQPRRSWPRS